MHHYARAVTHLRRAMLDEGASRSTEVLCATTLLQIYEVRPNQTYLRALY